MMRNAVVGTGLLAFAPALALAGGKAQPVNYRDLGSQVPIIGRLGIPLGKYVQIEGEMGKPERIKDVGFRVDRLDGKPVKADTRIEFENMPYPPAGVRCVLTGYETGKMIGMPDGLPPDIPAPQSGFRFYPTFVVVRVVSPPSVKASFERHRPHPEGERGPR